MAKFYYLLIYILDFSDSVWHLSLLSRPPTIHLPTTIDTNKTQEMCHLGELIVNPRRQIIPTNFSILYYQLNSHNLKGEDCSWSELGIKGLPKRQTLEIYIHKFSMTIISNVSLCIQRQLFQEKLESPLISETISVLLFKLHLKLLHVAVAIVLCCCWYNFMTLPLFETLLNNSNNYFGQDEIYYTDVIIIKCQ